MSSDVMCPTCGTNYSNIARHWLSNPDCEHPPYSATQHALLRGILLSHGSVEKGNAHPSLRVSSQQKAVLDWLDTEFGIFSRGVHQTHTAEEVRESLESRGWSVTGEASPMYEWGLRTHPDLERYYTDWYETTDDGRTRRVPAHVERHPATLRAWYLFAGRVARGDEAPHVVFPFTSMNADLQTVLNLLQPFNPRVYTDSHADDVEKRQDIHIRNSAQFFEYIGNPPAKSFKTDWPREGETLMADDTEGAECPSCGRHYTYLSAHWDGDTDCRFPPLTEDQKGVLTAFLLSGATLNQTGDGKRPHVLLDSTNLVFLDWARDVLGILCAHVTKRTDPKDTTARLQEWLGVESEDTKAVYRLQTRSHPFFEEAKANWADRIGDPDRAINPPDSLTRTPAFFRTLYLHRGSLSLYNSQQSPVLRVKRMPIADDALLDLFEPFAPRFTKLTSDHRVLLIEDDDAFFDFLGEPPLGLEDLWPEDRRHP